MSTRMRAAGAAPDPDAGTDAGETFVDHMLVVLGSGVEPPPGFLLGTSRLTMGAGEQDDIFLGGVGVLPGHVDLVFLEGKVTLLAAAKEIRIEGQPVTGFPLDLQPLQTLSLSPDTHVAYGLAGSAWPTPPVWELPQEPSEEEAALAASTPSATEAARAAQPTAQARTPRTMRQQVTGSARLGAVAVGVAAVIVSGLVVTDLVWGFREVVNPGGGAIDQSGTVLHKMLAADPASFRSVKLSVRPDGALALTGFLESDEAYRRLADQVRQQGVSSGGNVRFDAMTSERLSALVEDQISRFPLGSRIDVTPAKVLVTVFGAETEGVDLAPLEADLRRLATRVAPRALEFEFQLQPAAVFETEITASLAKAAATRNMQFKMSATGGHISGVVATTAQTEAEALVEELVKSYAGRLPLTTDIKADPKLNFSVVSVTLGGNESTVTLMQRGKAQTFRVGEQVFGTGELREIKADGVVLAMQRRVTFIPLIR